MKGKRERKGRWSRGERGRKSEGYGRGGEGANCADSRLLLLITYDCDAAKTKKKTKYNLHIILCELTTSFSIRNQYYQYNVIRHVISKYRNVLI